MSANRALNASQNRAFLASQNRAFGSQGDVVAGLLNDLHSLYNSGGNPGDWVSIGWDSIGTNRRHGHNPTPCYPGWAKLLERFMADPTANPVEGVRVLGIKEDANGDYVRTAQDTYSSRQWAVVSPTSFPDTAPDTNYTLQHSIVAPNHEVFWNYSWSGSWTYSAGNRRPRGYAVVVDGDGGGEDPWYPIATCSAATDEGIPPVETDTATLIGVVLVLYLRGYA